MKKRFLTIATIALAGGMLFTSCIGSFGLSRKLLSWNQTIDNKFVNAVIFFVLTPAYGITLAADAVVLNTIEFWSGTNPVEAGIVTEVQGKDGKYTVETLENGYNIKNEEGEEMDLVYNDETKEWNAISDGVTTKLIKFVGDNNVIAYVNGEEVTVELSQSGVLAFQQTVENSIFFAKK